MFISYCHEVEHIKVHRKLLWNPEEDVNLIAQPNKKGMESALNSRSKFIKIHMYIN